MDGEIPTLKRIELKLLEKYPDISIEYKYRYKEHQISALTFKSKEGWKFSVTRHKNWGGKQRIRIEIIRLKCNKSSNYILFDSENKNISQKIERIPNDILEYLYELKKHIIKAGEYDEKEEPTPIGKLQKKLL